MWYMLLVVMTLLDFKNAKAMVHEKLHENVFFSTHFTGTMIVFGNLLTVIMVKHLLKRHVL